MEIFKSIGIVAVGFAVVGFAVALVGLLFLSILNVFGEVGIWVSGFLLLFITITIAVHVFRTVKVDVRVR